MADCQGCNEEPCTCGELAGRQKPRTTEAVALFVPARRPEHGSVWPPLGLLAGTAGFILRRRRADIADLAAQLTYGLLGAALLTLLTVAVRR